MLGVDTNLLHSLANAGWGKRTSVYERMALTYCVVNEHRWSYSRADVGAIVMDTELPVDFHPHGASIGRWFNMRELAGAPLACGMRLLVHQGFTIYETITASSKERAYHI